MTAPNGTIGLRCPGGASKALYTQITCKNHSYGHAMLPNCCKKQLFLHIWNSSPDPGDSPDPPDQVSGAAVQDLPSTLARGQDDVSSKQTHSNES